MRLATLRRGGKDAGLPGVVGVARLDRRTDTLTDRLSVGDIAVTDHLDLDRASAEALVARGVAAVVNAAPSISGRYPNLGPQVLLDAGIPLLDNVGVAVFGAVRDGTKVRLHGDTLYIGNRVAATGTRQDGQTVAAAMRDAKAGLSTQLEAFAASTMEYLRRERALLLDGVGVPDIDTPLAGRQVVVVARGPDDEADLAALRPYLAEYRPVLIGVDGGADLLVAAGHRPDLVVGDVHQVSDQALRCGAEIVLQARPDGRAPGIERVQDLGVPAVTFPSSANSEDLAILLADAKAASVIVTVGAHATLAEFLDRGRAGMASTFLTRLRVGGTLVDAKAVSRLYRSRISGGALLLLVLAALVAVAAALAVSTAGPPLLSLLAAAWRRVAGGAGSLFQ
jgi:uncharacterized membrane-anchored protein